MGLRESINQNRNVTIGCIVTVVALVVVWSLFRGDGIQVDLPAGAESPKAFFTVDDGATWFADSDDKLPPFDYKGKEAVKCIIYKSGENGKPWVSSLLRFTPEGKKMRESGANAGGPRMGSRMEGAEVKKPKTGNTGWVSFNDPQAAAILQPRSPDGSKENPILVLPE